VRFHVNKLFITFIADMAMLLLRLCRRAILLCLNITWSPAFFLAIQFPFSNVGAGSVKMKIKKKKLSVESSEFWSFENDQKFLI
jgi:hypothetical protein